MNVRLCPDCVSQGVDCPLMLSGNCTHCGHRYAPISRRIADYEYRLRFEIRPLRFRPGGTTAGIRFRRVLAGVTARLG